MWLNQLRAMKEASGLTTRQVAQGSGIAEPTLEKLFAGATKDPKLETMRQLVHFFGHTLDDLEPPRPHPAKAAPAPAAVPEDECDRLARDIRALDEHGRRVVRLVLQEEQRRMAALANPTGRVIPLRRSLQPASAGAGVYLGPDEFEVIYVQENERTRRAAFALPVRGNSMEPAYADGDILLVEKAADLRPGETGVFIIDGAGYVKVLGDGALLSLNPAYAPIPLTPEARLAGRVAGILPAQWIAQGFPENR